jgi:hypothetical protein
VVTGASGGVGRALPDLPEPAHVVDEFVTEHDR